MIEALMTIMSSSGVGAITGGFFGWLNRKEDRKLRQADQEYDLKRLSAQSQADVQASDARSFEESQKTVSAIGGMIKSTVRPIITGALLYMTYSILIELERITGGLQTFSGDEAIRLYRDITLNIISLTATAVSWWFASRPSSINIGSHALTRHNESKK